MELQRVEQGRGRQHQNLMKLIGELKPGGDQAGAVLKATRMRSVLNCHRLADAYRDESRVAFVSEQFPTELVFAFGVIPWNIESMANMLAQSADVDRVFRLTQERHVSRDICSFLRGPYGMMLADCYPRPNLVLTNDQPCEGLSKLIYMAGKRYRSPVFPLHTPNTYDHEAVQYLVRQMQAMIAGMERDLGVEFDPEGLSRAVRRSNEAREYYNRTTQLLKDHSLPGVSRELLEIFGMNYFGTAENAKICKTMYQEAAELAGSGAKKMKRVLWIGQAPEEAHDLLQHMKKFVEVVYWAPLWEANSLVLDEDDPLPSMAKRAILYHWNAERMRPDLERMCEEYSIDSFMISSVWGCRNMMGLSPMIRDLAEERKLKCLTINIDVVDRNNYTFNHIKNRVDAFLEVMQ